MNKLHHKDFSIAFKTGTDANKSKFKKEAVQGEMYFATDSKNLYVAETTAGTSDATLSQFEGIQVFLNQYSVDFDGTNDYVHLTSAPSTAFDFGTGDFGLSMWVKGDSFSQPYHTVLGSYDNGSNNWQVFIGSAGLNIWNGALYGGGTINVGVWYNCVVTRSSGVLKTYINGTQNSSNTVTSSYTPSTSSSTVIGGFDGSSTWPRWNGLIDEVAIFNSGLSASNVTAIYNSGVPVDLGTDGLNLSPLGWWRMGDNDGAIGTTITDQGSGANDGTLTNGPTFSTNIPS